MFNLQYNFHVSVCLSFHDKDNVISHSVLKSSAQGTATVRNEQAFFQPEKIVEDNKLKGKNKWIKKI